MPTQTATAESTYYSELDTAPPILACLKDKFQNPIDLTGATVVLNVAYARWSHYYSPFRRIIDQQPCVVDPDQTEDGKRGVVRYFPGTESGVDAMTPAGSFHMTFEVTYADGGVQTIPPDTYLPLIIRSTVGGTRRNNVVPQT